LGKKEVKALEAQAQEADYKLPEAARYKYIKKKSSTTKRNTQAESKTYHHEQQVLQ
jgi:hypothetical protein